MASTATIGDLTATIRAIGRGVVFYQVGAFAGTGSDLTLVYLGDTEGDIGIEENAEFSMLTNPELTGPIAHQKYLEGIDPVITIPLLAADPALDEIVTPTAQAAGSQGGGYVHRVAVTEYSLVIFPLEVFIEAGLAAVVEYTTVGDWEVGGDVATAAQLALLDKSIFFWRGHFEQITKRFVHGDGGKLISDVVFHAMHNDDMQNGHHVYTKGRPDQAATPIEISTT